MIARWDWYQATIPGGDPGEILALLEDGFDLSSTAPGYPKNGYTKGAEVRRGDNVLARVWWEGNPGVHVVGTGENAPAVREVLAALGPHRVTRADACMDWVEVGLFDRLTALLLEYAQANRIKINQQGDWIRGEARSLYLGSRESPVQLVVYEKGYEAGGDLNWVRMEVRVRPVKDSRERVASWSPADCFRASRWLCEALEFAGFDALEPESIGTVWRPSDTQRARAAMLRQYGATLRTWADEVGSWEELGAILEAALEEETNGCV